MGHIIGTQVMPKRCGHMAGKSVISCEEMVGKIKAFLDARDSDDTLLIARTDALGVNGFDDAIERADRYLEAGADMLFIEPPASIVRMQIIAQRYGDQVPLVHNLVEGGGSPIPDSLTLRELNYKIALFPVALLHQFIPLSQQLLHHIKSSGRTDDYSGELIDLVETNKLLGAEELLQQSKQFE